MRLLPNFLSIVFAFTLFTNSYAQDFKQSIRGTIIDTDSEAPLVGATVIVKGSDPTLGTVTNKDGSFRLTDAPVGRVTLTISFVGYKEVTIPNLLIGSAKEEILNIALSESVSALDVIIITAGLEKGEALNEMSIASAHSFSAEETQRYAGTFDDPARMVVTFAGVNGDAEGNNDTLCEAILPREFCGDWRVLPSLIQIITQEKVPPEALSMP